MPAAAREPARDWARPSLVSADEATRDCAWIIPVDTPTPRDPALPSSVPEDAATVALPWTAPREYPCATAPALPMVVAADAAVSAVVSPDTAPDQAADTD
jgi:hypothetical protein